MRLQEFLSESNTSIADHYTQVLNARYKQFDLPVKITKHFIDRMHDPRNRETITAAEVADFFAKLIKKRHDFFQNLPDGEVVHVVDLESDVNVPIAKIDGVLVAKTVMRGEMRRAAQRRIAI